MIRIIVAAALLSVAVGNATPLVSIDWLKQNMDNGDTVLVDLRKAEDYQTGHIQGAVSAPYGEFGWRETVDGVVGMLPPLEKINDRIGSLGITPASHVVVIPYGATSSDVGSATRVYWTFKVLGHEKVSLLDGGMNSWYSQDLYTLESKANVPVSQGVYPGSVNDDLLIDTAELVALIESGEVQPIDARTDQQWEGKEKHPKAQVFGAIPTAQRLPQSELVDVITGKFVSKDVVIQIADANGWDPSDSKPLVSYCNTGHWASTAWFAMSEVAGLEDVQLYDGSMVAWTKDGNNPTINSPGRLEQILDRFKSK